MPLEIFYKKGALKKFARFKGKYLSRSTFLKKVAGVRSATLSKNILQHRYFPVSFAKRLKLIFCRAPPDDN